MKRIKLEKGITLIALIITIIVLLLLAVVAIAAVNDTGIIGHAEKSVNEHEAGRDLENSVLIGYENILNQYENGNDSETVTPTEQKYLLFTHDEKTSTSTFMGMNPDYKLKNGYYGEGDYVITDLVIPAVVKNDSGKESIVTRTDSIDKENGQNTTIKTIVLPETIESIGQRYTFCNWTALETINIPEKVTTIPPYTFSGCTSLTDITIPKRVTSIAPAFSGCTSLTTITIPKNVTSLSGPTFSGCTSLTTVTIEEGFNGSFMGPTFSGCTSLKTVHIPSSVISMTTGPFSACSSNTKIYVDKYEYECYSWGMGWNGNAKVVYKIQPELDQKYFTYDLDTTNKTATITGLNRNYSDGYMDGDRYYATVIKDKDNYIKDIIIPSKIIEDGEEYNVTTIGNLAFYTGWNGDTSYASNNFYSFVVPNTVTTIQAGAFVNIASVYYLPSSLQNIEGGIVRNQGSAAMTINIDKTKSQCSSWPSYWYGSATVKYKQ